MSKGRARHVTLLIFRIIQLLLSICALACAGYTTYTMYSLAESAKAIEEVINDLNQENDGVEVLQHSLVPVLRFLQGTPSRAITICVASGWSILIIIYLVFANRSARNSYRNLKRNSRVTRILLSILTLVLWITAIVCSVLLFIQYGIFTITVGPQAKLSMVILKTVIQEALEQASKGSKVISNALNIVGTITTIGAMSIAMLASSIICSIVALIDCFVACCMSGKATTQPIAQQQATNLEKGGYQATVTPISQTYSPQPQNWPSPQPVNNPQITVTPGVYYQNSR